jgi:hypothetical protein
VTAEYGKREKPRSAMISSGKTIDFLPCADYFFSERLGWDAKRPVSAQRADPRRFFIGEIRYAYLLS